MTDNQDRVIAGALHGRKGRVITVADGCHVPEGAIPINRTIIANMKTQNIENKPLSNIWPIYGGYIVCGTTWLLTAIGTYHIRQRLKLFSAARGLSYAFAPIGPCLFSGIIHHSTVVEPLLNDTAPDCPTCLPLRAASLNVLVGWALPTAMTTFVSSHIARLAYTYPVPPINEFNAYCKEMNKVTRKIRPIFGGTLALAAIVPFILALLEKNIVDKEGSVSLQEYEQHIHRLSTLGTDNKWEKSDTPT